jgi:hypothetical protein
MGRFDGGRYFGSTGNRPKVWHRPLVPGAESCVSEADTPDQDWTCFGYVSLRWAMSAAAGMYVKGNDMGEQSVFNVTLVPFHMHQSTVAPKTSQSFSKECPRSLNTVSTA